MSSPDLRNAPRPSIDRLYKNVLDKLKIDEYGSNLRPFDPNDAQGNDILNRVAHSRPALAINPPAFVRHILFFFGGRDLHEPVLYPGYFSREDARKDLETLILPLIPETRKDSEISQFKERFEKDQTYVAQLGEFCGFSLRVTIDIYSEYATMTLVLDNNSALMAESMRATNGPLLDHIKCAIAGSRDVVGEYKYMNYLSNGNYSDSGLVFFGLWDLLRSVKCLDIERSRIGPIFGDFRGFAVWPSSTAINRSASSSGKVSESGMVEITQPHEMAGVATNKEADHQYLFAPMPSNGGEQNVMRFLLNEQRFYLRCLGLNSDGSNAHPFPAERRMEPNIILCRMGDGDSIYGSALGNTFNDPRHPASEPQGLVPITYFIIHNGLSGNQLGRMIRRQNLLGELRLAALLDVDAIGDLGGPIRILAGMVNHLLSLGTRFATVGQTEFRQVLQLYVEIGKKCHGGLLYRMARAKYYHDALLERVSDTRSKPIRGWQSYPGFVRRHFDQRFRSMRSIGERYVEVGGRIERLFSIYMTERQRRFSLTPLVISAITIIFGVIPWFGALDRNFGEKAAFIFTAFVGAVIPYSIIAYYKNAIPSSIDRILRKRNYFVRRIIGIIGAICVGVGVAAFADEYYKTRTFLLIRYLFVGENGDRMPVLRGTDDTRKAPQVNGP